MADLDAGAHLRAVVARPRAQVGGVGGRGIGQLHELDQVVERLPVGEAAGGALQAELAEDCQHLLDHALHVGVRFGEHGLVDADPQALHGIVEAGDVVGHRQGRRPRDRAHRGRRGSPSVRARSSTWRAMHADGVERGRQRHGAGAADAAPGRLDGGDAAAGGRQPQRAAGVGAEAGGNGAVGDRGGRAGRRAAGDAGGVPGIAGVAQHVVVPRRAVGELGQMQRRDLQRAGRLEAGDRGGVLRRPACRRGSWRPSWRSCPCGRTCPCGRAARRRAAPWRCPWRWRHRRPWRRPAPRRPPAR